jgi:hypothetical protein
VARRLSCIDFMRALMGLDNAGHLLEAALAHFRYTGSRQFLDVMIRVSAIGGYSLLVPGRLMISSIAATRTWTALSLTLDLARIKRTDIPATPNWNSPSSVCTQLPRTLSIWNSADTCSKRVESAGRIKVESLTLLMKPNPDTRSFCPRPWMPSVPKREYRSAFQADHGWGS